MTDLERYVFATFTVIGMGATAYLFGYVAAGVVHWAVGKLRRKPAGIGLGTVDNATPPEVRAKLFI